MRRGESEMTWQNIPYPSRGSHRRGVDVFSNCTAPVCELFCVQRERNEAFNDEREKSETSRACNDLFQ